MNRKERLTFDLFLLTVFSLLSFVWLSLFCSFPLSVSLLYIFFPQFTDHLSLLGFFLYSSLERRALAFIWIYDFVSTNLRVFNMDFMWQTNKNIRCMELWSGGFQNNLRNRNLKNVTYISPSFLGLLLPDIKAECLSYLLKSESFSNSSYLSSDW